MNEFSIVVDIKFLNKARSIDLCPKKAQETARMLASKAGYRVLPADQLLIIGEYGIEQIMVPGGDGRWLHLSKVSITDKGALYEAHNIDSPLQQSFLMAVWHWWAGCVLFED